MRQFEKTVLPQIDLDPPGSVGPTAIVPQTDRHAWSAINTASIKATPQFHGATVNHSAGAAP